jgi:hypothetical protein
MQIINKVPVESKDLEDAELLAEVNRKFIK